MTFAGCEGGATGRPLRSDEFALLVDQSGKRYLIRLREGGEFHSHHGIVRHDDLIGQTEGVRAETQTGKRLWAFRPRLQDYVMEMPRSSTIMYPKDIGFLLMWADIFPGARVLEAGVGSGALSIALLRAIGPEGRLVSYDIRQDMVEQAQRNVHNFLGPTPNWALYIRDVYESIDGAFDRVVLDLPEPGRVAPHLASALDTGGIVCSFVPNVYQVQASVEAYRGTKLFVEIETYEVLIRPWLIRGPSVRPSPATMGHTGFLTIARRGAGPRFAILGPSSEGG